MLLRSHSGYAVSRGGFASPFFWLEKAEEGPVFAGCQHRERFRGCARRLAEEDLLQGVRPRGASQFGPTPPSDRAHCRCGSKSSTSVALVTFPGHLPVALCDARANTNFSIGRQAGFVSRIRLSSSWAIGYLGDVERGASLLPQPYPPDRRPARHYPTKQHADTAHRGG